MITEDTIQQEVHTLTSKIFDEIVHAEGVTMGDWADFSAISHVALTQAFAMNMLPMGLEDDMLDLFLEETTKAIKESYLEHYASMVPPNETIQ